MITDFDKELMAKSFTKDSFTQYRRIFKELFGRPAPTCDCDAGTVYNKIKAKIASMDTENTFQPLPASEELNENAEILMNKHPIKDQQTGKFTKKTEPENLTKEEKDKRFALTVKQEIYDGHNDLERIRRAYAIISGNENANIILMRRTILGYEG